MNNLQIPQAPKQSHTPALESGRKKILSSVICLLLASACQIDALAVEVVDGVDIQDLRVFLSKSEIQGAYIQRWLDRCSYTKEDFERYINGGGEFSTRIEKEKKKGDLIDRKTRFHSVVKQAETFRNILQKTLGYGDNCLKEFFLFLRTDSAFSTIGATIKTDYLEWKAQQDMPLEMPPEKNPEAPYPPPTYTAPAVTVHEPFSPYPPQPDQSFYPYNQERQPSGWLGPQQPPYGPGVPLQQPVAIPPVPQEPPAQSYSNTPPSPREQTARQQQPVVREESSSPAVDMETPTVQNLDPVSVPTPPTVVPTTTRVATSQPQTSLSHQPPPVSTITPTPRSGTQVTLSTTVPEPHVTVSATVPGPQQPIPCQTVTTQVTIPVPMQPPSTSASLIDRGMTVLANMQQKKLRQQQQQMATLTALPLGIGDDLETFRDRLVPIMRTFFLRTNKDANWVSIGVAWRHVGGTFKNFYDLMQTSPQSRQSHFQTHCKDMINVLLKYIDLITPDNVALQLSRAERAMLAGVQELGIDLHDLKRMVQEKYKTEPKLLRVQGCLTNFFDQKDHLFQGIPIAEIDTLLDRLHIPRSDYVYDVKSLIEHIKSWARYCPLEAGMTDRTSLKARVYRTLLELLARSCAPVNPEHATINELSRLTVLPADDEIDLEDMKEALLRVLAEHGTEEEIYAVIYLTAGQLIPDLSPRHRTGANRRGVAGYDSHVSPPTSTVLTDGHQYAGLFENPEQLLKAGGELQRLWKTVGIFCKLPDSQLATCNLTPFDGVGDASEPAIRMMKQVRDNTDTTFEAEKILLGAVKKAGYAGVAGRIWPRQK